MFMPAKKYGRTWAEFYEMHKCRITSAIANVAQMGKCMLEVWKQVP